VNILITGAAGFLGQRLARRLLEVETLADQPIRRITLLDVAQPAAPADPRVVSVTDDISDPAVVSRAIGADTDAVFHLAAIVSGMAEAEFELGMRVNLDATRALLDAARATGRVPRVVFTSSVAVFGGALPAVVGDATAVTPQTSYGAQKAIGEMLVNDYSRRGFIDGRALRLPTVSVRPGKPNAAASSFASGIIREPLNGEDAICPVDAGTRLLLISPRTVIDCLIHGHNLPAADLGHSRTVNLPGLSVTVDEMVKALERVAGREATARIRWAPDARIARMVATWPGAWDNSRAKALGFPADDDFESVIRQYVAEK
jgi:nucleoside-diphosphate-sugar epimerase